MKRILCFWLAGTLLLSLTACGTVEPPVAETELVASTVAETTVIAEPTVNTTAQTEMATAEPDPLVVPVNDETFVRVCSYIPTVKQELAYATVNNFTAVRIYDFTDAYLRYGTVRKLMEVSRILEAQGLGLVMWDAFRPIEAQAALWEICPDPTFVSNPNTGRRSHCRGNTVDVSLYDLATGEPVPMPTGFDHFTAYADRDYRDVSPEAAENAILLEETMKACGFEPYFAEWWHFSDSQDYPIAETFTPAVPETWTVNCEEYISLRDAPGGSVKVTIPKGETVTLLGWSGRYANVTWNGQEGFALSSYILPEDMALSDCLDTVAVERVYAYEQMLADLDALQVQYPDIVSLGTIGASSMGREIPVLRIGSENSKYHILIQGAVHGREYMTAWLLMAMGEYWLGHDILSYADVCYHIIPMVNPDGVVISQTQSLTDAQYTVYLSDREAGYTEDSEKIYAALWKANGLGTDINRNFPSGWEEIDDRKTPSSQKYRGEAPFSSPEASALRDYTLRYDFDATISYHASGSLIYYEYGTNRGVNVESESLASAVQTICGYTLESGEDTDGAGYKDWAMDALGIPSLTIEIGCEEAPLAEREMASVFVRNYRLLPALARWLELHN